tara:strand:+ start:4261 stop:4869 length:609 start_codon:yes stop_codon:yes gene_type:complete
MKGIVIKSGSQKVTELVPSGTHIGRCYSMIHIGTVEWEYQGEKKFSDKVRLTFELPHETREFSGEEKPMVISKEYTVSLHEKSNLRKDVEMWRGASLTNADLSGFDLTDLLGQPCNVTVVHGTAKNGNEYAKIGGLGKLTKGVECPVQFNETFIFNYHDNYNAEWLDTQPQWIQDQIKSTDEYTNKQNQLKYADTDKDNLPF